MPDARDFFVNQATPEGIGYDAHGRSRAALGGKGEFAIITASLTAANMIEWQKHIEARRAEKYPEHENGRVAPLRRPEGQGVRRSHRDLERQSRT